MNKLAIPILCIIFFFMLPLSANAQEPDKKLSEGYTEDGIYYAIYEVETEDTSTARAAGDTLEVTRKIIYSGIVQPPAQREYEETINGYKYVGILYLYSYSFEDGNTHAYFKGTLTATR